MKRSNFVKLLILVLAAVVTLSLFACNDGEEESSTKAPSESTEAKTDSKDETTDETDTEETDSETESDSNTETDTETDTNTETDSETETETETETSSCHPKYAYDENGHWSPACEICHKNTGKVRTHEFYEDIEDEGDLFLYSGICKTCGYVGYEIEVPYEVSLFFSPSDFNAGVVSNFAEGEFAFENGVGFSRFVSIGGKGTVRFYEGSDSDDVCGKYLVMRLRLNGGRTGFKIEISSMSAYNANASEATQGRVFAEISGISSGWTTVVVDMSKVVSGNKGYTPDANGDYYLKDIRLVMDGGNVVPVDDYVDIAYAMFCETLEEADSFILSHQQGYYKYTDVLENNEPEAVGKVCNHKYTWDNDKHTMEACELCGATAETADHYMTEISRGEKFMYGCVCGYHLSEKTVSKDVNLYLSANLLASSANAFTQAYSKGELLCENGITFARIWGKEKNDSGVNITDDKKTWMPYQFGTAVTGQFLVIQFRIPENGLGQSMLKFYTSTEKEWAINEEDGVSMPVSENNEWTTFIIDLANASGTGSGTSYKPGTDGSYAMKFIQMRLFSSQVANENCYTDISFVAVCDSLEEARSLVTENTYQYKSTGAAIGSYNKDGSCITHMAEEAVDGRTYTTKCKICGKNLAEKTVPESVNKYFSGSDISTLPSQFYNLNPSFMVEDDAAYTRLNFAGKTASQLIWTRMGSDGTGPYLNNGASTFTVDGGKFLVFRFRKNGDANNVEFTIGTMKGDVSYTNIANQKTKKITLQFNELDNDEWFTCVIDLETVMGDAWQADNGTYKVSYFQFTMYGNDSNPLSSSKYFDFEYFAFVDSWEEIAELSSDRTVHVFANGTQAASGKDGKCVSCKPVETIKKETSGEIKLTYACTVCGKSFPADRTVPASTNAFVGAGILNTNASNLCGSELVIENGEAYVRVNGKHTAQIDKDRYWKFDAYNNSTASVVTGQYLVIKYRIPNNGLSQTSFTLYVGNDGNGPMNENTSIRFSVTEDDQWHIAVIDLFAFFDAKTAGRTGYVANSDGKYCAKYVHIRPFSGHWAENGGANENDYLDMAYVAFCDSIAEVKELVGSATCDFYQAFESSALPNS